MSKYYNYSIKLPYINICYFCKNGIKNYKKEKKFKNNSDKKNKNEKKNNSIKRSYKAIDNLNKNKSLNNSNNKKVLSDIKVNNGDEKFSESSQNSLIIKKNNDIKTNEFLFNYNNDIINESDLEMYKKLDILPITFTSLAFPDFSIPFSIFL